MGLRRLWGARKGPGRGPRGSGLFSDNCVATKFLLMRPYFGHTTLFDGGLWRMDEDGWLMYHG